MQTTDNYGLKKPEQTDNYNVDDPNANMDIIDAQMKANATAASAAASAVTDMWTTVHTW